MKTTTKILIITLSLLLGLSIIFAILIKLNSDVIPPIEGSGNVVTQERPIKDFNTLRVDGNYKVFLSQGDSASLTIKADDNLLLVVHITQMDGVLDFHQFRRVSKESTLELHLTFVDLNALKVSRGGRVMGNDILNLDSFDLVVSAGANVDLTIESNVSKVSSSAGSHVELAGKTGSLEITSSSGSSVNCSELEAESVSIRTSSGANNKVWATSSITVKASSGSSVVYSGNPTTKIEKSSSGASIRPKN